MPTGVIDREAFTRLDGLRVRAREVGEALLSGHHESRFRGASVVFADHREYSPGDDPRTIDVRAWARTDRPVVRRFEHEARLSTTLLLDASGSMAFRSRPLLPTKHAHAALLLAALAYVLLRQGDAVASARFSEALEDETPLLVNLVSLDRVLDVLEGAPTPGAVTRIAEVLASLLPRVARRSVVAIASDFLEPGEPLEALRAYSASGHRILVFHVVDPAEVSFPFESSVEFHGLEGEAPVLADATSAKRAYLSAFAHHTETVKAACFAANARYVLASTEDAAERTLGEILALGPL